MRSAALLAAALAAAGCGSAHVVSGLDEEERAELAAIRVELGGRTVRVSGLDTGSPPAADTFEALRIAGAIPADARPGAPADLQVSRELGRCMNPMLGSAMTLGVLPYVMDGSYDRICRFASSDGSSFEMVRFDADDSIAFGWLPLPLAILPSWNLFFFSETRDGQRGAFVERFALFLGRELAKRPIGTPAK
jgi:hypothetical protein